MKFKLRAVIQVWRSGIDFFFLKAALLPTSFSQTGNSGKGLVARGICFAGLTLKTELLKKVKLYRNPPAQKTAAPCGSMVCSGFLLAKAILALTLLLCFDTINTTACPGCWTCCGQDRGEGARTSTPLPGVSWGIEQRYWICIKVRGGVSKWVWGLKASEKSSKTWRAVFRCRSQICCCCSSFEFPNQYWARPLRGRATRRRRETCATPRECAYL